MTKYQWVLLLAFFFVWLYTESEDYLSRKRHDEFFQQVDDFIHKGDRFTADDGRALSARVERLEYLLKKYNEAANEK